MSEIWGHLTWEGRLWYNRGIGRTCMSLENKRTGIDKRARIAKKLEIAKRLEEVIHSLRNQPESELINRWVRDLEEVHEHLFRRQ